MGETPGGRGRRTWSVRVVSFLSFFLFVLLRNLTQNCWFCVRRTTLTNVPNPIPNRRILQPSKTPLGHCQSRQSHLQHLPFLFFFFVEREIEEPTPGGRSCSRFLADGGGNREELRASDAEEGNGGQADGVGESRRSCFPFLSLSSFLPTNPTLFC